MGRRIQHSVSQEDTRRHEAEILAEECARVLKERFGARKVYVFGSVTGRAPWHERSDVDIAVEGLPPQEYMHALSALYELFPLGLELDLIPLEEAPPELVAHIRGEIEMPEDPIEAMKMRIGGELRSLDRVAQGLQSFLVRVPEEPSEMEVRGVGSYVHDFYNGIERIFERIAVGLEGSLPGGEKWHILLLEQMEAHRSGVRPAVIDHALEVRLLDYLRFRHRFRHTYGYRLEWDKLRPLAEGLSEILEVFRQELALFLDSL